METPDEILTIRTPEHTGFRYVLAGLGTRAMAFLIDTLIRGLFILAVFVSVSVVSGWIPALSVSVLKSLSKSWILALGILAYGVVDLGYFLLFEALWNGQTPGKRLQRLRVIRADGQPVGWLESSVRNILRAVDMISGVYPLGLIVMFLSRLSQRIGDYAAGTVVIVERRRRGLGEAAGRRTPDLEIHVGTLKPDQYRLIRSFLDRRHEMDGDHRRRLSRELASRLSAQWGLPPRGDTSCEPFLEDVAGTYERTRRAI